MVFRIQEAFQTFEDSTDNIPKLIIFMGKPVVLAIISVTPLQRCDVVVASICQRHSLQDLVWQPSPERFQLGVDEDESGNQDAAHHLPRSSNTKNSIEVTK